MGRRAGRETTLIPFMRVTDTRNRRSLGTNRSRLRVEFLVSPFSLPIPASSRHAHPLPSLSREIAKNLISSTQRALPVIFCTRHISFLCSPTTRVASIQRIEQLILQIFFSSSFVVLWKSNQSSHSARAFSKFIFPIDCLMQRILHSGSSQFVHCVENIAKTRVPSSISASRCTRNRIVFVVFERSKRINGNYKLDAKSNHSCHPIYIHLARFFLRFSSGYLVFFPDVLTMRERERER